MVLCFQCSADTKRDIDRLLGTTKYANLSELITVALSNQVLLHAHTEEDGTVVFGKITVPEPLKPVPAPADATDQEPESLDLSKRRVNGISALFIHCPATPGGPIAVWNSGAEGDVTGDIKPSLWIFGQYNRLLPAKVSCRALANLLRDGRGIDAAGAARKIAVEASELGGRLRILDRRLGRTRDEMFSTAFPGDVDADKGRIRFANQFVVSIDKNGRLSGLLFDLKLIGHVSNRDSRISLTEAGWRLALMKNPLLDAIDDDTVSNRFSAEETDFLLFHIGTSVPRERYAYVTILSAIANGKDTPDAISRVMKEIEQGSPENDSMIASQRSGAISRMSDLGLLARDREGIRVRYRLTASGSQFLVNR